MSDDKIILDQPIRDGWELELVEYNPRPFSKYVGKWSVRLQRGDHHVCGVSHNIPDAYRAANDAAGETDAFNPNENK